MKIFITVFTTISVLTLTVFLMFKIGLLQKLSWTEEPSSGINNFINKTVKEGGFPAYEISNCKGIKFINTIVFKKCIKAARL